MRHTLRDTIFEFLKADPQRNLPLLRSRLGLSRGEMARRALPPIGKRSVERIEAGEYVTDATLLRIALGLSDRVEKALLDTMKSA